MTLKGKWRIVEMALWDLDFLDMMEPAYILFDDKAGGEFAFGCVTGQIHCRAAATPPLSPDPGGLLQQPARAFPVHSAPARSPTRPPIAYDPVGGRVGERAGADSTQVGNAL